MPTPEPTEEMLAEWEMTGVSYLTEHQLAALIAALRASWKDVAWLEAARKMLMDRATAVGMAEGNVPDFIDRLVEELRASREECKRLRDKACEAE